MIAIVSPFADRSIARMCPVCEGPVVLVRRAAGCFRICEQSAIMVEEGTFGSFVLFRISVMTFRRAVCPVAFWSLGTSRPPQRWGCCSI